jgi:hypothetical protein
VGRKECSYTAGRTVTVQSLWRTVWRVLKNQKIEMLHDVAIPLLEVYLKECKSSYNTPMFIAALFTI